LTPLRAWFFKEGDVVENEEFGIASEEIPPFKERRQRGLVFAKWR
jgi:hypothetical protein